MNISLLFHTLLHLRPQQVFYQLWYRLYKPSYQVVETSVFQIPKLHTDPILRSRSLDGNVFTFLNLSHEFSGWDFNDYGNLWTYNQNYFDWLNQEGMTADEGGQWIDLFISRLSTLDSRLSLDPYPTALRSINWIKFFCRHPETVTKSRPNALYSQVKLLEKKLEYHLLGNHLLEDAYALYMSSVFFQDERLYKKASKLLFIQLNEQILPDGAHYEQSPMYHCILLDRLLDTINIGLGARVESQDVMESCSTKIATSEDLERLKSYAQQMLGHLESVVWEDKTIPLLNDSALGIAPEPKQLFDYAKRLGLEWKAMPMKECGYRKMVAGNMEAIVDVGNITASYQPGHSHADTFNFELRIGGKPFIVDTGISTYNKTQRRQFERSTSAHNTVTVNGKDSSEVWSGFRVGRRAKVYGEQSVNNDSGAIVEALHDGFGKPCKRRFEMTANEFIIEDWFDGEAISCIHLAENINPDIIQIKDSTRITKNECQYSTEYNKFHTGTVLKISFNGYMKYVINAKGQIHFF